MANVPQAVLAATTNLRIREAMLLGSSLEGGWTAPFPPGDQGTSFGPYQMHIGGALTASGLSPAQANDAVLATKAMLPAYTRGVLSVPDSLWQSNPQHAAEQAAMVAERPAQDYYTTQGQGNINQKWNQVQSVLSGQNNTTGQPNNAGTASNTGGGSSGGGTSIGSILGNVLLSGSGLGGLASVFGLGGGAVKSWGERIGLVIFGGLMVLAGILIFAMPAVKGAAKIAGQATVAGKAFGVGSAAAAADKQRRQAIADRSMQLGEEKLAQRKSEVAHRQQIQERTLSLQESRETRHVAREATA